MVLSKISQVKQLHTACAWLLCQAGHFKWNKEGGGCGGGGGGCDAVVRGSSSPSVLCVISEKTPNIVTVRLGQASLAGESLPLPLPAVCLTVTL